MYTVMIDERELSVIAQQAHLSLSGEESVSLKAEVSRMLDYFSAMEQVDVDNLEPTTHSCIKKNQLRKDEVLGENRSDSLLDNAPELEERFFTVPNVL